MFIHNFRGPHKNVVELIHFSEKLNGGVIPHKDIQYNNFLFGNGHYNYESLEGAI